MNSIDIRHFVDINIINRKEKTEISSTRDVVALLTLDEHYAPSSQAYTEYSSLEELDEIRDELITKGYYNETDHKFYEHKSETTYSDEISPVVGNIYIDIDTNTSYKYASSSYSVVTVYSYDATYQYAKVYFNNGGVKLRLINANFGNSGSAYTEITDEIALPFVKELPNEIIVVSVVNSDITNNYSTMLDLADAYNESTIDGFKVYGINEKIFITNAEYTITQFADLTSHKNVALKLISQSTFSQVGGEMTIAAYLSQIDVYASNSVKDYSFTSENVDVNYPVENLNPYVKNTINNLLNMSVDIIGARNIGGNLVTGEDLVNKYVLIILHQTLSQRVFNVLTQKLKGNECITAIYAAMSRELNKYLYNGYLSTDKVWTNEDLKVSKKGVNYTLISKGTALVQGYKITILPFASLDSSEIQEHKLPYIYVVLADSYNIRKATINGETI